jgi:hypothetical protein
MTSEKQARRVIGMDLDSQPRAGQGAHRIVLEKLDFSELLRPAFSVRGAPVGTLQQPKPHRTGGLASATGRENYRVTQGVNCSSFWSLAATDSASRRVGNLPTRTRYTGGVPVAGATTYAA